MNFVIYNKFTGAIIKEYQTERGAKIAFAHAARSKTLWALVADGQLGLLSLKDYTWRNYQGIPRGMTYDVDRK